MIIFSSISILFAIADGIYVSFGDFHENFETCLHYYGPQDYDKCYSGADCWSQACECVYYGGSYVYYNGSWNINCDWDDNNYECYCGYDDYYRCTVVDDYKKFGTIGIWGPYIGLIAGIFGLLAYNRRTNTLITWHYILVIKFKISNK